MLRALVVPADATATVNSIIASEGLFRSGIAAFLIVIVMDVVVAWALYVLPETLQFRFARVLKPPGCSKKAPDTPPEACSTCTFYLQNELFLE